MAKLVKLNRPWPDPKVALAFRRAMERSAGGAREDAPKGMTGASGINVGDVQGGLAASITTEGPTITGTKLHGRFGSGLRYAMMREKGGTIRPVRKPRLAWRDVKTGKWVVLRPGQSVTQRPGGPRQGYRPFLGPNGDRWPDYMTAELKRLG